MLLVDLTKETKNNLENRTLKITQTEMQKKKVRIILNKKRETVMAKTVRPSKKMQYLCNWNNRRQRKGRQTVKIFKYFSINHRYHKLREHK